MLFDKISDLLDVYKRYHKYLFLKNLMIIKIWNSSGQFLWLTFLTNPIAFHVKCMNWINDHINSTFITNKWISFTKIEHKNHIFNLIWYWQIKTILRYSVKSAKYFLLFLKILEIRKWNHHSGNVETIIY